MATFWTDDLIQGGKKFGHENSIRFLDDGLGLELGYVMASGKQRVLLVEDDDDSREAMAAVLELWDVDVDSTADGTQALALAETNRYRAVLVDLSIPPPDGYFLARALKARPHPPTVIAVTGRSDSATEARAYNAGFDHFFTKPVNLDSLSRVLIQNT